MNARWVREVRSVGLALVLACLPASCSHPQPDIPQETVRGKVTYRGEPLPAGFLVFYRAELPSTYCEIKPDGSGNYEVSVPAGLYQVVVRWAPRLDAPPHWDSRMPTGRSRRSPSIPGVDLTARQAKILDEVEQKYGSLKSAKPLTFAVNPGEQTWNINLD